MPYRFILFDLDDTLYPADSGLWEVLGERILQFMTERLAIPSEEVQRLRGTYYARYGTTLAGLMTDFPGMDPDEYLAFVHDAPLEKYLRPNPALGAVLGRTPLRKVVFTNSDEAHSQRVLACLGLSGHFERIIDIRALEFVNKPRPEAYDRALEILSAAPDECIIVEDLARNLRPAKSMGMTTILVGGDGATPDEAVDYHVRRVEEVGSVLQALGAGFVISARAILYGLALGDALGWPVEFLSAQDIRRRFGPAGIVEPPDPARFTDDTGLTLAIGRALVESGEADEETIMTAVRREFIAWMHHPDTPQRAPGVTTIRAVDALERGVPWRQAGLKDSKGCGSAMRVAAVGYLYQHDSDKLRRVAHATGWATHQHPAADAACVAAAFLVKLALDGVPPSEYLQHTLKFTEGISSEFESACLRIGHTLGWNDTSAALRHIGPTRGGGWTGEEAVAMALYCVLKHPDDYPSAVRLAANIGGDSDSVACIAGGLLGARLGLAAIPPAWIARLERREEIDLLAEQLAEKRSRG